MRILGTGHAVPTRHVTAADLDRSMQRKPGWSQAVSGVRVRHLAGPEIEQSTLAAQALHNALAQADVDGDSIDLLISTAAVPEQALPGMAGAIAAKANLRPGIAAFDVHACCLGFMVALHNASALLAAGLYKRIAIVASDLASRGVNWNDPGASLIFGDGAAAVIIDGQDDSARILAYRLQTWPQWRDLCEVRIGGTRRNPRTAVTDDDFLFRMDGPGLFRHVREVMPAFLNALFRQAPTLKDIDWVVPHQASHLAMRHMARFLRLDDERIVNIYAHHGNQVSASIPTALDIALRDGRIGTGQRILLLGTAAGLSICGMVLQL